MTEEKCKIKNEISKKNNELLMIPNNVKNLKKTTLTTHKRMGSTGTTGDESTNTTDDDEDEIDNDDYNNIKERNFFTNNFSSYSGISTITDKINQISIPRNNSDISSEDISYSDIEKCCSVGDESVNDSTKISENIDTIDWAKPSSIENVDKFTFTELKSSLKEAQQQLKAKKEEINKLNQIKQEVEAELEDLTASLFQEAHNMVREANEKQATAEKALKESDMKVEVLMAEVAALKTLVITSTPSSPNPHLHPQIDKNKDEGVVIYNKKHNRSPSHSNLKYGRLDSPESPTKVPMCSQNIRNSQSDIEVDPILFNEFLLWKDKPTFSKTNLFISRIYDEDIDLCLSFTNNELSEKVKDAVEKGMILIEAIGEKSKSFPKECALMKVSRICSYRMNLGDDSDDWYNISQICRNRITAVCDFFNYLKYIERGLVKSPVEDMYNEVMKLRKNIILGRLGFQTNS